MGPLSDERQGGRKGLEFFTESVEKLWISSPFVECKFGFLLRIWLFAQILVNCFLAIEKIFYFIYIQLFSGLARPAQVGLASEI